MAFFCASREGVKRPSNVEGPSKSNVFGIQSQTSFSKSNLTAAIDSQMKTPIFFPVGMKFLKVGTKGGYEIPPSITEFLDVGNKFWGDCFLFPLFLFILKKYVYKY